MIATPVEVAKLLVSKLALHAHFDFGSQLDPSEDAKPPANPIGSIAHSLETPTFILPPLQLLRIDAASVVADGDAQLSWPELDQYLNGLRPGMAVGGDNSFAAHAIHV